MVIQAFKSKYITLHAQDPFIIIAYKKDVTIDLVAAKEIVRERLAVTGEHDYPTLVDIRGAKLFTKEARDYFAKDGVKGFSALALLGGNRITVITANLFMSLSRPRVPTKLFLTREAALKWLEKFVPS